MASHPARIRHIILMVACVIALLATAVVRNYYGTCRPQYIEVWGHSIVPREPPWGGRRYGFCIGSERYDPGGTPEGASIRCNGIEVSQFLGCLIGLD